MNHGHKKIGLFFSDEQLLEKVKQVMTEDLPTSDTSNLVRDIFSNVKDAAKFSEELKGVVLSTEVKNINVVLLIDGIVNNTEQREKSGEWRGHMEPHLQEISEILLKSPKTASLYGTAMGKWMKKKMFVGDILEKLSSLVTVEKEPEDKITGQKRKREDPKEGDEKILKKQKLD